MRRLIFYCWIKSVTAKNQKVSKCVGISLTTHIELHENPKANWCQAAEWVVPIKTSGFIDMEITHLLHAELHYWQGRLKPLKATVGTFCSLNAIFALFFQGKLCLSRLRMSNYCETGLCAANVTCQSEKCAIGLLFMNKIISVVKRSISHADIMCYVLIVIKVYEFTYFFLFANTIFFIFFKVNQ